MLALLTSLALASGSCTNTPIPYVPVTVDLFGQAHLVEGFGYDVDRDHVKQTVGITSLDVYQYTTDDTDMWLDLTDLIEQEIASMPGLIVEATLLTTDTTPDHDIDRADVKGMSVKIRRLGKFYHRFYKYDVQVPIRQQVLLLLTQQPRTEKELRKALGRSAGGIHYHLVRLEEQGRAVRGPGVPALWRAA